MPTAVWVLHKHLYTTLASPVLQSRVAFGCGRHRQFGGGEAEKNRVGLTESKSTGGDGDLTESKN